MDRETVNQYLGRVQKARARFMAAPVWSAEESAAERDYAEACIMYAMACDVYAAASREAAQGEPNEH